jgi:hypothetical protein
MSGGYLLAAEMLPEAERGQVPLPTSLLDQQQMWLAVGAAVLIGGMIFLLAYWGRYRQTRRLVSGTGSIRRRSSGHRRRREHRPRHPTLAETGGLPPARPDQP